MITTGMIKSSEQHKYLERADEERRLTHEVLLTKLAQREGIRDERGREVPIKADEWCFGYKTARANEIFTKRMFMGEVHAHVFANRFTKEIVIVGWRGGDCIPVHYQPGYRAAKQISTRTAISLRAQKPDVLWLLLIRDHFEALQPI